SSEDEPVVQGNRCRKDQLGSSKGRLGPSMRPSLDLTVERHVKGLENGKSGGATPESTKLLDPEREKLPTPTADRGEMVRSNSAPGPVTEGLACTHCCKSYYDIELSVVITVVDKLSSSAVQSLKFDPERVRIRLLPIRLAECSSEQRCLI